MTGSARSGRSSASWLRLELVDSRRFGLDAGLRPLTPTLPPFRLLDAIHISGCLFMNKSARNPRSKDDPCLPSVRGERVARQAIVGVSFP